MNADKESVIEMLAAANDLIEGLDGNEDALTKAIDHIEAAIVLVDKYGIDE